MDASVQALSPDQAGVVNSGSWGAGIFGVIYLIAMKAYTHALIAFIGSIVPVVNIGVWIYYILKGKQLAWQFRPWKSYDDFLACQRIWDTWAKWIFGISLAFGVLATLILIAGER